MPLTLNFEIRSRADDDPECSGAYRVSSAAITFTDFASAGHA
ncbi:hypothetical protein [Roseiflexus sp.]|nr:hypothetical protein [Roseiflexus sp.]